MHRASLRRVATPRGAQAEKAARDRLGAPRAEAVTTATADKSILQNRPHRGRFLIFWNPPGDEMFGISTEEMSNGLQHDGV